MAFPIIRHILREVPRPRLLMSVNKQFHSVAVGVQECNVYQRNRHCVFFNNNMGHISICGCYVKSNTIYTSSVLSKDKKLPPKNTLVQLVDSNKKGVAVMAYGQLQNFARLRKQNVVHLPDVTFSGSDLQVFMLTENDKDENVKGKSAQGSKNQVLELKSRITDHDLEHKLRKLNNWIAKGHEVRVAILKKDENAKAIAKLIKKVTAAVEGRATVKQSSVNMDKTVAATVHLTPIQDQSSTSSDNELKPLKLHGNNQKATSD